MALLFPVTARFFDQWIGYVLNHILVVVLTATVLTLGVMIYDHELAKVTVGTGDQNMALIAFELLIIAGILYAIVKSVAGMASALAGGLSMAVLSIGQMTGAARTAASVGKGAGKTIASAGNLSGWVGGKALQAVNAMKGGNSIASSPQPAYRAGLREMMQKQNRPARN
jgi:type IV secretion system protein VirB6